MSELLRERGVRLIITTLGIDTGTIVGRLVYGIVAQIAEAERERIIERTNAGLAAARGRDQLLGRRPKLSKHQREFAKQMVADGKTYAEVAAHFGVSRTAAYRAVNGERARPPKKEAA